MRTTFRPGPLGSLIDVYEDAFESFMRVLDSVDRKIYEQIIRLEAENPDCASIQTMMRHVILAGYGYANYVREVWAMPMSKPDITLLSIDEAMDHLRKMFSYTLETFEGRYAMTDAEVCSTIVQTRWGPKLDLEVLLEHAICHLFRHARMIEMYRKS